MRIALISTIAAAALLSGCATGMHARHHDHAEMMANCPAMAEHHREHASAESAGHHGGHEGEEGANHEGMNHEHMDHANMTDEEMARHCEMMRQHHEAQEAGETPGTHQH